MKPKLRIAMAGAGFANEQGVRPQLVRQAFFAELERLLIGEVFIHQLDVLRWLLGPLRIVAARTGRRVPQSLSAQFNQRLTMR